MGLTQRATPKHCNGDLCAGRFMSVSESSKESNTITRRKATIASIQNEQYTLKTTGTQTEYVLSQEASHWGETWFWCPLDKYHRSYRATKEKWSPESGGGSQASTSKCNWVRRLRTRPVIKGQYLCPPPARAKIRCRQRFTARTPHICIVLLIYYAIAFATATIHLASCVDWRQSNDFTKSPKDSHYCDLGDDFSPASTDMQGTQACASPCEDTR